MSYVAGSFAGLGELKDQTGALKEQNRNLATQGGKLDTIISLLEKLVAIEEENFKIKHGREFKLPVVKLVQGVNSIGGGVSGGSNSNKPTLPSGVSAITDNSSKNKPTLPKV
ncbi:MAG TPA: hypothetical protein VFR94_03755 [Nitrososphaeraceae archaeon]|nr:hypothetical protein [Nitrososphaeraceae archaeon]